MQNTPPANAPQTLVIGCGNLLRGDDAVGSTVVRQLAKSGLPDHVRCLDAGTSGLEVALAMRDVDQVVLIDAAVAGSDRPPQPGSIHEFSPDHIPGADTAATSGISTHSLRWDHALALACALAGDRPLPQVRCYLIEGSAFGHGEPLSPPVAAAAEKLSDRLAAAFRGAHGPSTGNSNPDTRPAAST